MIFEVTFKRSSFSVVNLNIYSPEQRLAQCALVALINYYR